MILQLLKEMSSQTKKRGGSIQKASAQSTSRSDTSSSSTTQTIYERQELETRTHRTPSAGAAVPEVGGSGLVGSPLTRHQEKEELKGLNTRLAHYIDTIRSQQEEIVVLRRKVETVNTQESHEATRLRDRYESEIANLRKALDEVSKDLAAATTERDALLADKDNSAQLERDVAALKKKVRDLEAQLKDARADLSRERDNKRDHDNQINALNDENKLLKTQNDTLKKELQRETVQRVDAENRLLSEKEELKFQKSLHEEQVRSLREQRTVEVTEVETRLHDDFNSKMVDQLDQLRAELEAVARETREELEHSYGSQMEDLQNLANRYANDARHVFDDLKEAQNRLKEVQGKTDRDQRDLRAQVAKLQAELNQKDADLQRLQQLLADRQAELQKTHHDLSSQLTEYQMLLDEKIQLDAELATYHALLKTEETRLNMQSPPFPSTPDSARRGTKRRLTSDSTQVTRTRFRNEASASGVVHIIEIDAEGQFVKLENKSNQDIVIGGWQLHMVSDDGSKSESRYTIHRNQTLRAHSSMTIWSANSNVVHEPPADIVMEGRWLMGDVTVVRLYDAENVEVARREMARSSSHDSPVLGPSGLPKRLRLIESDSEVVDGADQKNCVIM